MAQLVEHNLAKVGVAGSSPVVRSIVCKEPIEESALFIRRLGQVVRQRPAKPLPPVRIRASPPELCRASMWAPFLVCTRAAGGTLTCPELAAPPLSPCCKNALPPGTSVGAVRRDGEPSGRAAAKWHDPIHVLLWTIIWSQSGSW